jgi:hypothetical protein
MRKRKPPIKKVQTGGGRHISENATPPKTITQTTKDDKTISTADRKFFAEYRLWLGTHKYEVISGFIVAVMAVFIASWLTRILEQKARNKATKQILNLVFLETEHNGKNVATILDNYAVAEVNHISVVRLDSSATEAAFRDTNLQSFLSFERIAFLRTYINTITAFNLSMQLFLGVLEREGYRTDSKVEELRHVVYTNAASVAAASVIMQEELEEYLDESTFDKENLKNIRGRFELYKEKARKGKFSVSYE